ncbi:MAG: hypothetical protein E7056_03610 [Lentisphaerae bacterium]|nr:hypothetical protein [Lentisphaerota bacterium]
MLKKIGDYLEICDFFAETVSTPDPERGQRGVIKGFLKTNTPVKVLYMASLELDNIEMHESVRLSIESGENTLELPEISVINPIVSSNGEGGKYTLTLKIYASGAVEHRFDTEIGF